MKKLFFIYNPQAGKAQIKNKLLDILNIFSFAGYQVTVAPTQNAGDAYKLAYENADKFDLIACCGGDGTLDDVVSGIAQNGTKIPMGYIPAGSTNDFASSLGLSKDMIEAAKTIMNGKVFSCDIGMFNDKPFVYIAAFGLFTDVSYATPQDVKNAIGHAAYILEGMKRLPSMRSYKVKVHCGDEIIEDDFILGMISNSTSVGGFKNITGKYVELDDGLFEVILVKMPKNVLEVNQIMTALINGDIENCDCIYCRKVSSVIVESEEKISWTLDGEFGGECECAQIGIRSKEIDIMVPEPD